MELCITQEQLKERFERLNPTLKLISEIPSERMATAKVYCTICKQTFDRRKCDFQTNEKSGCPICSKKIIIKGVNDVATTDSWMVKYFANEEDAYINPSGSTKNVIMKCPICGNTRKMQINNLRLRKYFVCNYCGDKVSYPNKFSRNLLLQLHVENLIPEYSPKWIAPKRFDNYFEYNGDKYILEMDGGFHYMDNTYDGSSVEVSENNDFRKDLVAKFHGIEVIRVDCRSLNLGGIRQEIEKSRLSEIFDLSKVDWNKCDLESQKPLTVKAWNLFNEGKRIFEIEKEIGVNRQTVRKYLKKGAAIGKVDYQCEDGKRVVPKDIEIYTIDNEYIDSCSSFYECVDILLRIKPQEKFSYITAKKYCSSEKPYKGFLIRRRIA